MQVFCEWMQARRDQREEESKVLRKQMIEAFAEAERRHKEMVARMLEEAEVANGNSKD